MPERQPDHRRVHRPTIQYDGTNLVQSHGTHNPVRAILHDTESHDVPKSSDDLAGVARFWNTQRDAAGNLTGYGAHVGVDAEGNSARYVDDKEIAYHTGGRNTGSLGLEMIGFSWFTRMTWWVKRRPQMHKVAKWMAYWHKAYGIPLKWDVERGFSTHRMQSKAYPALTDHTDPGAFFPKRRVMKLARKYARKGWA